MLRSKIYFWAIVWIFCVYSLLADDTIDCNNEDIVTSIFNEPIPLDLDNSTIRIYENVTIDSLMSTSNSEFDIKYIDARLVPNGNRTNDTNDTKNLMIFTTGNFLNYAEEQTAIRITLKVIIACAEGGRERTLIFFQPLSEGNYFNPIFSRDVYEICLPTPVLRGFDLTYFAEISARDNDVWNNRITFTSDNVQALMANSFSLT